MPNQRICGQLFFAFCFFSLSTTTSAQQSVDLVPVASASQVTGQTLKSLRKTGLQYHRLLRSGYQSQSRQPDDDASTLSWKLSSPAYKNQRFRRVGKTNGTSAPRRRQLMGVAYKNKRFKVSRARVARFKRRQ